jgi:hypothetical protein
MEPMALTKLGGVKATILILFTAKLTLDFQIAGDREHHQMRFL